MSDLPDPPLTDRTLTCVECQQPFVFAAGEQRYFATKDLTPPKRCQKCRAIKRARYEAASSAGTLPHMNGFEYR